MNKLILDTSTDYLYVSVIKDDKDVFTEVLYGKNNHSEHLIGIVEKGLSGMPAKELDEIIVGIGPGSYTGVRVGLTVGKVLAWTIKKPLKIISSLSLICSGYLDCDGIYGVSSVAKKGHVYGKIIEVKNGKIKVLFDDNFLTDEEFVEVLSKYNATNISKDNYKFNNLIIDKLSNKVEEVHEVVPNYLRKANS